MDVFDWIAPERLDVDQAALTIAGPWLALASFLSSLGDRNASLRLGSASEDEFSWRGSRSGFGRSAALFRARCPMGLGVGALASISTQWPTLAFAASHRDPHAGVELHWLQAGSASAGGLDSRTSFSAMEAQAMGAWARADGALLGAPLGSIWSARARAALLEAAPGAFERGSFFNAPREPLDVVRMLAGFEPLDPATWEALATVDGEVFRLAPAPWWPTPPSPWDGGSGASLLGSMATRPELSELDRCLAVRRALSSPRAAGLDPSACGAWIWAALSRAASSVAGRAAWTRACHSARAADCFELGYALRGSPASLSDWWSSHELASLALARPESARSLMLGCGADRWGYSLAELDELSESSPEVGSLATERLLVALAREGEASGSGSSRL